MRIMIVDDAVFMRQMLSKILKDAGFEICGEASTAPEAVEKYKKLKPDLVTMDIIMPMMEELDGIGAVREIIKFAPDAKILIVSAMTQQSLIVEAIRSGAKDCIAKPFQPSQIIEAVKKVLGQSPLDKRSRE